MNSKKFQHIFFASLFILSFLSSFYLNFHVELTDEASSIAGLTESQNESSEKLMADIDAFKHILQNVIKQLVFN